MKKKEIVYCDKCKAEIPEEDINNFYCRDTQNNDAYYVNFCSASCMKSWVIGKLIGMIIALGIGLAICISFLFSNSPSEQALALPILFIPYMVRRLFRSSFGLLDGGEFKTFVELFLVLILSITFIYPLFKLIQEIIFFHNIFALLYPKKTVDINDAQETSDAVSDLPVAIPKTTKDNVSARNSESPISDSHPADNNTDKINKPLSESFQIDIPETNNYSNEFLSSETSVSSENVTIVSNSTHIAQSTASSTNYAPVCQNTNENIVVSPAYIYDANKRKTIEINKPTFASPEVRFSGPEGMSLITYEDGRWYLNGRVSSFFDLKLNDRKIIQYSNILLLNNDKIVLIGASPKSKTEYRGKTFTYIFSTENINDNKSASDAKQKSQFINSRPPRQHSIAEIRKEAIFEEYFDTPQAFLYNAKTDKTIEIMRLKYVPTEVRLSGPTEASLIIKLEQEWYLDGRISKFFDLKLNEELISEYAYFILRPGDRIMLEGNCFKSKEKYQRETFEYIFYLENPKGKYYNEDKSPVN